MKTSISARQIDEAGDYIREKLRAYIDRKETRIEPPSIERVKFTEQLTVEQMITLLSEGRHANRFTMELFYTNPMNTAWTVNYDKRSFVHKELCDALWEAVKAYL